MNHIPGKTRKIHVRLAGFTLVEAAISIVLVSVLLVAALNTVAAAKLGQMKTAERGQAHLLAQELMSEIMRQDYADPEDVGRIDLRASPSASSIGRDSGESGTNRVDCDDVDDYVGWNASPPQNRDGTPIPNLDGWRRLVTVERRSLADSGQFTANEEGLKHITVQVERDGALIAQLEAFKGVGLPPLPPEPSVLFVVTDDATPNSDELARQALIESWSFTVSLISATALQADFDSAVVNADVAYVSGDIQAGDLGTKLSNATIGIITEEGQSYDELGLAERETTYSGVSALDIVDNAHYVTSSFGIETTDIFDSGQILETAAPAFALAPDLQVLGQNPGGSAAALGVLEVGDLQWETGTAVGRRVMVPWGSGFAVLNADGQTMMKRAIEWAAGMEKP